MKDIVSDFRTLVRFIENKDHLIDKLNLTDDQKKELKDFFRAHPNFENKIDWNNKSLQYKDFEEVLKLEGNTKSSKKKYGLSGKAQIEDLVEGTDYEVIAEDKDSVLYFVKTFKGSEVLAKPTTPPEGITGKWCIAGRNYSPGTGDQHWKSYTGSRIKFFFYFDKKDPAKFAFSVRFITPGDSRNEIRIFDQEDRVISTTYYKLHNLGTAEKTIKKYCNDNWNQIIFLADKTVSDLINSLNTGNAFGWFCHKDPEHFGDAWCFSFWKPGALGGHPVLNTDNGIEEFKQAITELEIPTRFMSPDHKMEEITVIAPYACYDYKALKYVYLPKFVTNIESGAFRNCTSLEFVNFRSLEYLKSIRSQAFAGTGFKEIYMDNPIKLDIEIFRNCRKLETITLPWGLNTIPRGLFRDCTTLKEVKAVHLGTGIAEACWHNYADLTLNPSCQGWAFENCYNLESIELPYGIVYSGDHAFEGLKSLKKLIVPGSFMEFKDSFKNDSALTVIIKGPKRQITGLDLLPEGSEIIWEKK